MIAFVGLGGVLGALARFLLGRWVTSRVSAEFPWGTLLINISGSLVLGSLFALRSHQDLPNWLWLLFGVGFCGAYTTFSTFGFETISLLQKRAVKYAFYYVLSSTLFSILAAWVGITWFHS